VRTTRSLPRRKLCFVTSTKATRLIRELAERQHGVLARWQLVEMGLGKGAIQDRIRSGRLLPIHRGVFAVGHRRIGLRGEWMAAVLASGCGAVLSHGSAAHLWGLRRSHGAIEVSRCSGLRRRPGIQVHQCRSLPPADVTTEAGIRVTSIERTLLDIAAGLDARLLERAVVAADRSGRLRWPELERVLAAGRGRKGAARLRRVVMQVDPSARDAISPLEVDFLALCREAGVPAPEVNVLVGGHVVDFLRPDKRVIVEADGYRYHRDRPAFERDHELTVALTAAGYEVHRATYRMLERNPRPFLEIIRRSLQR
jgi:hypothetical protein